MMVKFVEDRQASVMLEVSDYDTVCMGPDEVDSVDQQLITFVAAFRLVCARRWACDSHDVQVAVQRRHDVEASWQGWRVVARRAASWEGDLDVALAAPLAARAGLQAAQKKRAC